MFGVGIAHSIYCRFLTIVFIKFRSIAPSTVWRLFQTIITMMIMKIRRF